MFNIIMRIISFIMALFIPASAAGSIMPDIDRAAATETFYEYGMLYYTVDENNEITITSVKDTGTSLGDVSIPEEIDGKPVKYFKCNSVYDRTDIDSLTFPYECELLDLGIVFSENELSIPKVICPKYSLAHKAAYSNYLNFELTDDDGSENFVWLNWYIDDGEAYISGIRERWHWCNVVYDEPVDPLNIPSELEGCPVVSVAGMYGSEDAHGYGIISLKKVILPSSVKCIDYMGFFNLKSLESINLDDGVEIIESSAFEDCWGLQSVVLGSSIKRIGSSAFVGCINLDTITVLSRDAVLEDFCFSTYDILSTTIYCYAGSTAHDYAVENDMNYVLIDESSLAPAAGSSVNIGANGLVRGVPLSVTAAELENLLSVDGSAEIRITDNSGNIGTGTRIDLINSTYGNVESSYYLVYSGDINGDGAVDNSDYFIVYHVLAGDMEFENPAQFAAADLNGDGMFLICDCTLLKSVMAGGTLLDPVTGKLTLAV